MKEQKLAAVEAEIAAEKAAALSRSSQGLRTALESLRRFDSGAPGLEPARLKPRDALVGEAANACMGYVVQWEALGFPAFDDASFRREYAVPAEVWERMGVVLKS